METAEQREARIQQLQEARAQRRGLAAPTGPAPIEASAPGVVEVAPGRGNLTRNSVPTAPSAPILPAPWMPQTYQDHVRTVDGRQISFAWIFATQPWVAAAIMRMMTWAIRVPLKVYRRTGEDSRLRLRPGDHPLADAVQRPYPGGFPARLTMDLLGPFLVHGNSVTGIDEGRSGRIQFDPRDWRTITPIQLTSTSPIDGWQLYDDTGQKAGTYASDVAIHAAWWSPLGPTGVSPLHQLGVTLRIEDAATRYQQAQFRNGARPPSAIEATPEFLGLDEKVRDALLAQLRDDVTALYAGPENQGRPALLPPGLQWKPVGHTSHEAELVEQRYIDREEIAAVFQIPPPSLGDLRRATYSNITELRQVAYTDGLGPPLVIIEQIITARFQDLLRDPEIYVEFDFSGVLRGDTLKEINALRGAISMGMMTPNEARTVRNMPRSDEERADQLWMPWNNLWPMGQEPPAAANRAARRQQAREMRDEEARGHATIFVAESWRSRVERERTEQYVEVADYLRDEEQDQTAEEAMA